MVKKQIDVIVPDEQPAVWHKSIETLPFDKFIECDVTGNLHHLIISGMPASEDLSLAWIDIQQEYAEAMDRYEQSLNTSLQKECTDLAATYRMVKQAVELMKLAYSEYLASWLNENLFRSFKFDYKDAEEYNRELNLCLSLRKRIWIDYTRKKEALDALQKAASGIPQSKRSTRAGYMKILIVIGNYGGVHLTASMILTSEFCERVRQYEAYVTAHNNNNKKQDASS